MVRPIRLFLWLLATVALVPALGAATLVVGPGQAFTDIQAAVDAAQPGDVILVEPGTYGAFAVTKPLRILGAGSGVVRVVEPTGEGVHVEGIGAGDEVVISGMEVDTMPFVLFGDPFVLHAKDCDGTVVFHDLLVQNEPQAPGLGVEGCARVLLLDSTLAGAGASGSTVTLGAVQCTDSTLWIANSVLVGFHPAITGIQYPGSQGLEASGSTVHAWRSELRGGNGSGGKPAFFTPPDGGHGATLDNSALFLYGGPTALLAGGNGTSGGLFGGNGVGGHGVELSNGSFLLQQTDVPVVGGFDASGAVQQAPLGVDGTSGLTLDPTVYPTLDATAVQGAIGGSFNLNTAGSAGGLAFLFTSVGTGPDVVVPGVGGIGLLDLTTLFALGTTTLDGTGFATQAVFVPANPAFIGVTLFFQSVEAVGLQVGVTNPVLVPVIG